MWPGRQWNIRMEDDIVYLGCVGGLPSVSLLSNAPPSLELPLGWSCSFAHHCCCCHFPWPHWQQPPTVNCLLQPKGVKINSHVPCRACFSHTSSSDTFTTFRSLVPSLSLLTLYITHNHTPTLTSASPVKPALSPISTFPNQPCRFLIRTFPLVRCQFVQVGFLPIF